MTDGVVAVAPAAGRAVVVVRPGALTTVQDAGRPGHAHLGVPRSGALDPGAAALANRLVGNGPSAAVLETTLTGCALRPRAPMTAAVTGAACTVRVDGRPAAWGAAVSVPAGGVLDVGPAVHGVRSYVALAGGVSVDPVLGSRSTDLLSGLGPPPLATGTVLPLGAPAALHARVDTAPQPGPPGELVLPVAWGPRHHWCTAAALATLTTGRYRVSPASNRIGLRTEGPPLERRIRDELPSEGMVLGAVQVPPDGRPVVFLADHPTTGGYPVVAVVREPALAAAAQAAPGTPVRFVVAGRNAEGVGSGSSGSSSEAGAGPPPATAHDAG
ncbi:biotin-dependent carboxyltransferase family protein [Streptomyces sp. TS71-3]|uniref:5-oxoprolinase subunit C family protein n=1 Tax=Streptomyces sp. TS71-3 TaxID=2733862 RepID=UPI002017CB6D|nr:biotin-dependent carboxyltransferase family protein [Streptomyces sp. TS71-3]